MVWLYDPYESILHKDVEDVVDYTMNWADWLQLSLGDIIISSSWEANREGLTFVGTSSAAETATIVVSGGTAGTSYVLANTIETSQGRTQRRVILVGVSDLLHPVL